MKSINTAAPRAGVQLSCAQNAESGFRPVLRWTLYNLVQGCSKRLRLNSGDLRAFRALLSYLPLKDAAGAEIPAQPGMLLVCYASNSSICSRAEGMDESNFRLHARKLIAAGLIARRDSATGKRFPLKRNGQIYDAFGFDLGPAFRMAASLAAELAEIEADAEERKMLRTETFSLRRQLLDGFQALDDATRDFLGQLTNILRRKTTSIEQIRTARDHLLALAEHILGRRMSPRASEDALRLTAVNPEVDAPAAATDAPAPSMDELSETPLLPVSDAQITRQVESQTLNIKKMATELHEVGSAPPESYEQMLRMHPNAAPYLPAQTRSRTELMDCLRGIGLSLGLRDLPYGELIQAFGLSFLIGIFDRMIERVASIAHPQSYFESAVRRHALGR